MVKADISYFSKWQFNIGWEDQSAHPRSPPLWLIISPWRGKFYALSELFFIFVLTMTHFSDRLSDGAIIFILVRHMHVWILFISPPPLSQNSVIEKHLPTTINYIQIKLQCVPKIGVARCFKTRLFPRMFSSQTCFPYHLSIFTQIHSHSLSPYEPFPNPTVHSLLENHSLVMPIKPVN